MKLNLLAHRSRLDALLTCFIYLCALGVLATSSRYAGAISPNYKQAPQPLEDWLLVLKSNTDPDTFASTLCADNNPLHKQYNYSCTGTFRTLVKGISGRFSRAAVRQIQLRYKDAVERATRDRGLSIGDELVTAEERAQLGALMATAITPTPTMDPATTNTTTRTPTTPAAATLTFTRLSPAAGRLLPEQLDPVTWGLDRIDQSVLPLDHIYHYYSLGTGVNVYVIDSGVRASHIQFRVLLPVESTNTTPTSTTSSSDSSSSNESSAAASRGTPAPATTSAPDSTKSGPAFQPGTTSRVTQGFCAMDTCLAATTGGTSSSSSSGSTTAGSGGSGTVTTGTGGVSGGGDQTDDCYGHGTHVAALIGGLDTGVAKNVTIVPVKVLDCYGNANEATLLRALDWVSENLVTPAVVHMSIEGYYSGPVNAAVEELVARHNVVVVASAGNHNSDACSVSPASAQSAIAVGAIEADGTRWYNSNWGPCLDLFAPGVNLISAVPWKISAMASKTGTSMAAPFVSGVAALYLQDHPGASATDVTQRLLRSSLSGGVTDDRYGAGTFTPRTQSTPWGPLDISTTPNRLLQAALTIPASLTPAVVPVQQQPATTSLASTTSTSTSSFVDVVLLLQPTAQVNMTACVPAGWDGAPLVALIPAALFFTPEDYSSPRRLMLNTALGGGQGDFLVQLIMRSSDYRFDFAVQDFKVVDTRPLAGETASVPRVIPELPFRDSGDTSGFHHDYTTSEDNPLDTAPDVVYILTTPRSMSLTVSTCGSSYDTVLLLGLGGPTGLSLDNAFANDDDPSCGSDLLSASCSRIDVDVDGGVPVYVVVSGFNGAAGRYVLSVVCSSCAEKVMESGVAAVAVS